MLDWTITNPDKIGSSVRLTFCSAHWCCTLHLPPPAGWEGWGLHQPPRVQNRPRHRMQAEIVSLHHMSPELLIKHICSLSLPHNVSTHTHRAYHAYTETLISLPVWLQCLQSMPSQNQELLLRHRLSRGNEQVSAAASLGINSHLKPRMSRVFAWVFSLWKWSSHEATKTLCMNKTWSWSSVNKCRAGNLREFVWVMCVCLCERGIVVIFAQVLSDELKLSTPLLNDMWR